MRGHRSLKEDRVLLVLSANSVVVHLLAAEFYDWKVTCFKLNIGHTARIAGMHSL